MPPTLVRRPISKDRFSAIFATAKPQTYYDPSSRGTGPHTIRSIAWNNTGSFIATGGADRLVRIWNPERANVKNSTELRGHGLGVERVAWDPTKDGGLASVSGDGGVKFWDVRSAKCLGEAKTGGENFTLAWHPEGTAVAVGRKDDHVTFIDTRTYNTFHTIKEAVQTNQLIWSHSGNALLITTGEGRVRILSYPEFEPLYTINAHTSACFCLEMDPRGKYLAVGGSDALISLWDTQDWMCKHTLGHMEGPLRSVAFSWDGSYIVGGSDEGTGLEIAHVETGEYVHTIPTTHPSSCVAWHPSRYWLAYTGDPMGLKIIGAAGGNV
ncbi:MAG: hypothetical protein M1840_004982 [Geoglossum simile]|nr:MAG: hypothetical protein M1840_004982 [Geoglossum simile]